MRSLRIIHKGAKATGDNSDRILPKAEGLNGSEGAVNLMDQNEEWKIEEIRIGLKETLYLPNPVLTKNPV